MPLDLSNRSTRALSAAAAVLALVVILELLYPAQPADFDVVAENAGAAVVPDFGETDIEAPRFEDLGNMLERPLFFSDRQLPIPPQVAATPEAPAAPLRLKLEGVAITGESRIAVLRDLSNNQLLQLAEGMMHEGWTLDSVSSNNASFSRGAETAELVLDPNSGQRRR